MRRLLLILVDSARACLGTRLRKLGFDVRAISEIRPGDVARAGADLALIDGSSHANNVNDAVREIRAYSSLPVIVLCDDSCVTERIVTLELGADDVVSIDVDELELRARIHAVLRREDIGRQDARDEELLEVGDISLHGGSRTVVRSGDRLNLTAVEFDLLKLLLGSAGYVVTREVIAREVFRRSTPGQTRAIDVHVSGLRKKLGPGKDGEDRIRTIRGYGYLYVNGWCDGQLAAVPRM